ncbi:DNA polymerase III subunit delta [Rhodohalobacter halophilus]|uniref:DNA polymerase III subunit delta n=1 Tax=Rhodohalobacter halophilus TaxID=1812810 RepID=UPI00083F58F0|nr:DNA polymerase III subunit delta [Rhodohalobacter halophilus]
MARYKSSIDLFREAFRELKSGSNIRPIYYLYGEEDFFKDLLQEEIEKLVPPEQKDFNFDLIYGNDSTPAQVLGIARSFPMMAERRVVIVKDFTKLGDKTDDGTLNDFTAYVKQPNPSCVLCLIDSKFPDKRTGLGKELNKNNLVAEYEFEEVADYQLPDWISDWTKNIHKREIHPAATQILAQMVGPNLKLLSTEIEKVCTFVDTGERIEKEHIKKISGSYRDYTVIELKEAVIERNLEKALGISEQMLQQKNYSVGEVIKTLGFFYMVFSNIWRICRLTEKGLNKNQVQSELGIKNSYIFNAQWREASQFRLAEMPRIFEALLDADRASKGFSTLDTSSIFLLMLKRIIG